MRDDGDFNQCDDSGESEKWSDSGYILKDFVIRCKLLRWGGVMKLKAKRFYLPLSNMK